ncbi:MAG TPA: PIG-L family deacetylase [Steroidobacteraceae bacterium]|nr:PIG-L family deacetylase [Steroidobacteraceae bacterium]
MTIQAPPAGRRSGLRLLRTSLLSMLAVLLGAALRPAGASEARAGGIPPIDSRTSLLVVSPHPDDETLCCAGVIRRVVAAGGRASIVWLTSGDGSELDSLFIERSLRVQPGKMRDLARKRMGEARAAAAILGVPPGRQFFLGYPDGGLLMLLTDHYTVPYYSRFNGADRVPYSGTAALGHPYTGESLERDFARVLDRVRPTLVLAPSPRDAHPDHRAAGILTLQVLSRRHELRAARFWIVHGGRDWPRPRALRMRLPLPPPPRGRGLGLVAFPLDPLEEAAKLQALRQYHTQMRVMSSFLLAFVRSDELYASRPVPLPRTGAAVASGR